MHANRNTHPFYLIQRRSWAQDLTELVRDLQAAQTRVVTENDVLNALFSRRRDDPETAALVKQVRKSIYRAVVLNQRIFRLRRKQREEFEDAIYDAGEEELTSLEEGGYLAEKLLTEH